MHGFDLDIKPFGEVSKQGDGQFSDLNQSAPRQDRHANNKGGKASGGDHRPADERHEGRQAMFDLMTQDALHVLDVNREEREEALAKKSAVEIETIENASKLLKTSQLHLAVIHDYMTEDFIADAMASMGCPVAMVNLPRMDEPPYLPKGHAFLEFASVLDAEEALKKCNGKLIPNSAPLLRFKLNRSIRELRRAGIDDKDTFSIWVGSLTEDVTSDQLFDFFAERYPSTVGAKVVFDQDGQSRGFGFVNMMDEEQFRMSCSDMKGGTGLGGNPLEIRAGLTNVFANKNSAECQAWIEGRENRQAFEAAKAAIVANYNTNVKDDYEMNHQLEKYAVDETDDPDELVDHKFAVLEDVRELNKQFLYDHFETMCLPFSLYTPLDIGKTKFSDDHVRAWFQ
jgi:hypothetical protein